MKDLTLANGEVVTQEKFIELCSHGEDTLTEFLATEDDVRLLAERLVEKLAGLEWMASECIGSVENYELNYLKQRLVRVLKFMPVIEVEIKERLRVARLKNKIDLRDRSLPKNPGCPKCFSPFERQQAVFDAMPCTMRATTNGQWELGELQADAPYTAFSTFLCPDCGNHYTAFHSRNGHDVAAWEVKLEEKKGGLPQG